MAHLALEQRCEAIKNKFGLDRLSTWPLRKCYRAHRIAYRLPQYCYSRKLKRD